MYMSEAAARKEATTKPVTQAEVVELVDSKLGRFKDRPTVASMNKKFEERDTRLDEIVGELSGQGELAAELKARMDSLAETVEQAAEATDPSAVGAFKEVIDLKIAQVEDLVSRAVSQTDIAQATAQAAMHRADYLQGALGVKPEDETLTRTAVMAPVRFVNMQPRLRHGLEFALGAGIWLLVARLLETRFALPTGWVAVLLAGATGVVVGESLIIGGTVLFHTIETYRETNAAPVVGRTV
jgi:hypothetical protein